MAIVLVVIVLVMVLGLGITIHSLKTRLAGVDGNNKT